MYTVLPLKQERQLPRWTEQEEEKHKVHTETHQNVHGRWIKNDGYFVYIFFLNMIVTDLHITSEIQE